MSGSTNQRGFLTQSDRTYLRGEHDGFDQPANERRKRQQIRERARRAIEDFAFLLQYMQRRDRIQIVDEFARRHDEIYAKATGEERRQGPPEVHWDILYDPDVLWYGIFTGGLRSMQGFIALLLYDLCEDMDLSEERFEGLFTELVREGLRDGLGQMGIAVDVDIEMELEKYDVDFEGLRSRFEEEPEALTKQEIEWLSHARELEWDEYWTYLRRVREPADDT